jgi:AcrR family transcriptional regulator
MTGAGKSPDALEAARPRGRPRSAEAHQAILTATLKLLGEHGLAGLSIEGVAAEAGVGKTTIYRRWENKGELVGDAVGLLRPPPGTVPDTGTFVGDLDALSAAQRARLGGTPVARIIPRLLADTVEDEALHRLVLERAVGPIRAIVRQIVDRAVERGELREDLDREAIVDVFHAIPVYKVLLSGGNLDAAIPLPAKYGPMLLEGLAPRAKG